MSTTPEYVDWLVKRMWALIVAGTGTRLQVAVWRGLDARKLAEISAMEWPFDCAERADIKAANEQFLDQFRDNVRTNGRFPTEVPSGR